MTSREISVPIMDAMTDVEVLALVSTGAAKGCFDLQKETEDALLRLRQRKLWNSIQNSGRHVRLSGHF